MVFLLIRGTSGSYVLSVSVLTIIGKMQKFPIIDFPYKYIKRLVFHFFFTLEIIIRIRSEIDASVVNQEFSVDFPLRFTRSFTFSHFRSVTEADALRYIRETRKNMLFTRSYQCIKAW